MEEVPFDYKDLMRETKNVLVSVLEFQALIFFKYCFPGNEFSSIMIKVANFH